LFAKEEGRGVKQQKTDRRSQRTYRLVSSAFAELVGEKPYEEILAQDILDRAGIGRTTFYVHYFDKEDVLTGSHAIAVLAHLDQESLKYLVNKAKSGQVFFFRGGGNHLNIIIEGRWWLRHIGKKNRWQN
jgi:CubicO group peptidase (beta-lactamase class C family)